MRGEPITIEHFVIDTINVTIEHNHPSHTWGTRKGLSPKTKGEFLSKLMRVNLARFFLFITHRFYSCLVNNVTFKYKDVHAAAAEVIGLLMKREGDVEKVRILSKSMFRTWCSREILLTFCCFFFIFLP